MGNAAAVARRIPEANRRAFARHLPAYLERLEKLHAARVAAIPPATRAAVDERSRWFARIHRSAFVHEDANSPLYETWLMIHHSAPPSEAEVWGALATHNAKFKRVRANPTLKGAGWWTPDDEALYALWTAVSFPNAAPATPPPPASLSRQRGGRRRTTRRRTRKKAARPHRLTKFARFVRDRARDLPTAGAAGGARLSPQDRLRALARMSRHGETPTEAVRRVRAGRR